ncbi:MAG TPA: FAD-dependent oxidoreductase, partial [Thermodesulfovibrionales bacterium]|nr:FAD-dependent oxidoreductase [Thermodesulfovibrionales bacterium]
MKRVKFSIFVFISVLIAFVVPTMCVSDMQSGEGSAQASPAAPFLADLHKEKKLDCSACHGKKTTVDDNETIVNKKCIECHGSLDKLAIDQKPSEEDQPSGSGEEGVNPHKSHLGKINCTTCHHGHTASWTYCLSCHSFEMKIPAGAVAAELPRAKESTPVTKIPKDIKTQKTDVVVIGAGAAGFTAAITGHDKGAKVILLEKQPITGGNSMLAAGGMNAAETSFQKAKGIKDSVDLMYEDTMKGGKNLNDPELVKVLAKNSAGSVEWLTKLGADLSDVGRMGGASVNRTHRPSGGSAVGAHLIEVLRKNAEQRKIDVRVNSKVVKILEDKKGRVIGVLVEGKHSGLYRILAKAVV